MSNLTKKSLIFLFSLMAIMSPQAVQAMHIAEGFLPVKWCIIYFVLSLPFIVLGIRDIKNKTLKSKDLKMLLALVGAYAFVLSAMKIPSVTGSSSHPTGTGLGAIIFGPFSMAIMGSLVLVFQAVLLAHGGITTLGANIFSMAIVGPIISFLTYKLLKDKNKKLAIFLAAMLGDLGTYIITSIQLALAFPDKTGGFILSLEKFLGVFALTQVPLAIIEGIITVIVFEFIEKYATKELVELGEVI